MPPERRKSFPVSTGRFTFIVERIADTDAVVGYGGATLLAVQLKMGCDIHLFVEVVLPDEVYAWAGGEIRVERDYRLFGSLAGVRSDEPPLIPPRGLPLNVNYRIFDEYYIIIIPASEAPVHRGWSWVTPDEAARWLAVGNSHQPPQEMLLGKRSSPLGYISDPDLHTPSWMWHDEVLRAVPDSIVATNPSFRIVLEVLGSIERLLRPARARIVFWFDN